MTDNNSWLQTVFVLLARNCLNNKQLIFRTTLQRVSVFALMTFLLHRLTSEIATQTLEGLAIHLTEHHCAVNLTATKLRQLAQSPAAVFVMLG